SFPTRRSSDLRRRAGRRWAPGRRAGPPTPRAPRPPRRAAAPSRSAPARRAPEALVGPSLGAVLDGAGERVGADDQDERDHDERDVIRGAEEAIGVVDQRAHARLAAEDLADDHAD